MPQPLRKSFQKSASSGGKPRRFTFSLSGVAVAALGLVLVAAVGWAFFMGFMVGRGQNPEKSVEQMTGMLRDEQAQPAAPSSPPQSQRADPRQTQRAPAAQPKAAQAEPLFDYSFQVAAFKDKADADKLRARLESKGLRSRQQKSGKVLLVLVNLRGTELDAANLREELQRMKLGKPILASKKAVSGKSRKTGR